MLFLYRLQQNIILNIGLSMKAKTRNLSQKHQIKPHQLQSTNTFAMKNRSQVSFEEYNAKEVLSKFDEQNHHTQVSIDQEDIIGWQWNKQNESRNLDSFQKDNRVCYERKYTCKLQPINTKNIEKSSSTNDTINYLKHMLCLLRSSRETAQAQQPTLKEINRNNQKSKPHQTLPDKNSSALQSKKKKKKKCLDIQSIEKENQYNDAQIIDQLINGLTKLPKIYQSKKSTLNMRSKRRSKFTLDKLLI